MSGCVDRESSRPRNHTRNVEAAADCSKRNVRKAFRITEESYIPGKTEKYRAVECGVG